MNHLLPPPLSTIRELYMERPYHVAHWSLGRWFCEVIGLPKLEHFNPYTCQNLTDSLQLISKLDLSAYPCELFSAWNKIHRDRLNYDAPPQV